MRLPAEQLAEYHRDGFLVINDFADTASCEALRTRAAELVHDFDASGIVSIFSTHEQSRLSDDYFLNSGDKIRCFFEEDAFLPDGTLKQSKEQSINKIGHALHDFDPVFNEFSHRPAIEELVADLAIERPLLLQGMYIFKQPKIGGEVTCHQDSTFLYTEPQSIAGLWSRPFLLLSGAGRVKPLRAESVFVFAGYNERFDHLGVNKVAIKLVQLRQPEIVAAVV